MEFKKNIDSRIGPRWIGIGKNKWLNPHRSNPLWYLNHSCTPNLARKGVTRLVALRNIDKGEEVTIDYSITEADPHWLMLCRCGGKNCRKKIRSIHFLPPKIFQSYMPYIPAYLQNFFHSNNTNGQKF